jgi:hypothetical protein
MQHRESGETGLCRPGNGHPPAVRAFGIVVGITRVYA